MRAMRGARSTPRKAERIAHSIASSSFGRMIGIFAAAIASAAVMLHSAVDYPLRTAAMSAVFAMCLALILQSRRSVQSDSDLRPARHLVVG